MFIADVASHDLLNLPTAFLGPARLLQFFIVEDMNHLGDGVFHRFGGSVGAESASVNASSASMPIVTARSGGCPFRRRRNLTGDPVGYLTHELVPLG